MAIVLLALLAGDTALAQTNLETNAGVQFNFSTPGAASLGQGGAFLALADDATAAYANPAGLTQLGEPEVSFELRSFRFTHRFTDRGRLTGEPTGIGIDTEAGLREGEANDHVSNLSFLSAVYPRKHWAVAVYRHELVNFEANFETQGAFLLRTRSRSPLGIPGQLDGRLASLRNSMDLTIVNHGLSFGFRLSRAWSLGAGLSHYDFSLRSRADRFVPPLRSACTPQLCRPQDVTNFQTQEGVDTDVGVNLGFLWRSRGTGWSVGGVHRSGPSFDLEARSRPGPGLPPGFSFVESRQAARFHVPTFWGLGIAFQPTDAIRIALDWDRVEYSVLTEDFVDVFDLAALFPGTEPELERFRVDDADEVHLGFEYAFFQRKVPISLRLGAWFDPDHSIRFEGENPSSGAVFRSRGDEIHYSAGVGITFRRLRLDAAFDYSERISIASISTVVRF